MDIRNKYALTTVRIIFGAFMIFASIAGYIGAKAIVSGSPMAGLTQVEIDATKIFWNTGILQLAKLMELVVGLMFIFNFLPALAAVFMAPISVGIVIYNAMMAPQNLPISIIIALFNIYFGYVYFDKYKALFKK